MLTNKQLSIVKNDLYNEFLKINNLQSKQSQHKCHNVEFQID